jgi:TolA-binding protein
MTGCVPPMNNSTGQRVSKQEMQIVNSSYTKSKKYKNINKNKSETDDKNNPSVANNRSENGEYNNILEFEKRIGNSKSNTRNSNNSTPETSAKSKALPSLKEQIEELYQKQDATDESIYNLKGDLIEIKGMISEIAAEKFQPVAAKQSPTSTNNLSKLSNDSDMDFPQNHSIIHSDEESMTDDNLIIDDAKNKAVQKQEKSPSSATKPEEKSTPKQNKNFKIVKDTPQKSSNDSKDNSKEKDNSQPETNTAINTNNNASSPNAEANETNTKTTESDFSNIISAIAKKDYNAAVKQINDKMKTAKNAEIIANCNYWLGECSFNQRDYSKSIDYYKQALSKQCDKKDVAQARLAEAYLRVGKNDEAKVAYQTLLREYPKSTHTPTAKKMLQQL